MNKTNTDLKSKAIDIKGKLYVLVSDRIIAFNELYPDGQITTELLSGVSDKMVIIKATVTPDGKRIFTGHSQAIWGDGYINKSSALENAETSAVGRALAMMGLGVIDSVASVDEIKKATTQTIEPVMLGKGLTAECTIHKGETLTERVSKNGNPYFAHNIAGTNKLCFGKTIK